MSGPSRQFEQQHEQTLARLRARIPDGCPLVVERLDAAAAWRTRLGFRVRGPGCDFHGRAQVAAAFIDGYARAWEQRAEPRETYVRHECPVCELWRAHLIVEHVYERGIVLLRCCECFTLQTVAITALRAPERDGGGS